MRHSALTASSFTLYNAKHQWHTEPSLSFFYNLVTSSEDHFLHLFFLVSVSNHCAMKAYIRKISAHSYKASCFWFVFRRFLVWISHRTQNIL